MPYGKEFVMSEELVWIIRNTLYKNGYTEADLGSNRWIYEEDGLKCLTCEGDSKIKIRKDDNGNYDGKKIDLESFDRLQIDGNYTVILKEGERDYAFVSGDEWEVEKTELSVKDGRLKVESPHRSSQTKNVQIILHAKDLENLRVDGRANLRLEGWNQDRLSLELRGSTLCEFDGNVDDFQISVRDRAKVILNGKGSILDINARDAGVVRAYGFEVNQVNVEARDGSMVKVHTTGQSNIKERDGAKVHVKDQDRD